MASGEPSNKSPVDVNCTGSRSRRVRPGSFPATVALLFAAIVALTATLAFTSRAGAFVYWSNVGTNTIGRANLNGTCPNRSFIRAKTSGGWHGPSGLDVDATHIYWANDAPGSRRASLGRANLDGMGVDQSFISGGDFGTGVAVDAAHVYWANEHGLTIGRANLDGTGVDQSFISATGATRALGVAVDPAHVYWGNDGLNTIGRANLDGTEVDQSFIAGAYPGGVEVDAGHIYWANHRLNTIGRANLDGTGVDPRFIGGANGPAGVAVDAGHIYWANQALGAPRTTIGRANLDGTGVNHRFIRGASFPLGVAVDARPSSVFCFGKVTKNRHKGTARLPVKVPGSGHVELRGKEIERASEDALRTRRVELPVRPTGTKKRRLERAGEVTVTARVTYTRTGSTPHTKSRRIKLIKRR